MNLKEATKCINNVLNSDYHYDESLGYQLTSDDFEWLELAVEAIEKQTPKKPEFEGEYYVCPVCRVYQETSEGNPPYCINCGQRILMTELKKCPFCGSEAEIESYDPYDGYQGDCTVWRVKCL